MRYLLHDNYHAGIGKTVIGSHTTFRKAVDAAKAWADKIEVRPGSWVTVMIRNMMITEEPEPDAPVVSEKAVYWTFTKSGDVRRQTRRLFGCE
jgi:hypothetical protein